MIFLFHLNLMIELRKENYQFKVVFELKVKPLEDGLKVPTTTRILREFYSFKIFSIVISIQPLGSLILSHHLIQKGSMPLLLVFRYVFYYLDRKDLLKISLIDTFR